MAPDILQFASTLLRPQEWFKQTPCPDGCKKLYYSKFPVPGIYTKTPKGRRFLVAIKPNGQKDDEGVFRSGLDLDSPPTSSWSSRSNSTTASRTTTSSYATTTTFASSTTSTRSISFADPQPATKRSRSNSKSKPSTPVSSHKGKKTRVERCDINGFKALRKPLQIKHCKLLNRWMFSAEIEEREITTLVCASKTCDDLCPGTCDKGVWRDFFALDDGFSYVVVGERRKGKNVKQTCEKGDLYCVDGMRECLRRQDKLEVELSRRMLEEAVNRPRNVFFDDQADYMPILRYMGLGPICDKL